MSEKLRGNYRLQIRENYRLPKTLSELHEDEPDEEPKRKGKEKKVLYVKKK